MESETVLEGSGLCGECRVGPTEFNWARGYGEYDGVLRHLIHLLKYAGMRPLARPLAERLASLLAQAGPVDLIVPVPLHRRRRWSRGFNQAELLAEALGRLSGLPVETSVLRRYRPTLSQTGLTREQRRQNVKGAFRAGHPGRIAGKNVALVDDVITTGATVDACAAVLKRAGAAGVVVLAIARARVRIGELEPVQPTVPNRSPAREVSCGTA
ncbi:MAG: ComF family protein [Acidobacteria bacterium]|nr:ComF family protein [Acidobacteriota bacterium]